MVLNPDRTAFSDSTTDTPGWPSNRRLQTALATLTLLWRFRTPEPYVVAVAGALGLLLH